MKRIISLIICLFMVCICPMMVFAEENGIYENAGQLYQAWGSQNSTPDYISGVWSTDGSTENLTFGVVKGEAGEQGKREILALVRDDNTVTIVYQTYSRNYLYQIQREIVDTYFEAGLGLVTAGVMELENALRFEVHTDYADNADTQAMIQQVTEQYGDAVYFRYVDTYPHFVNGTQPTPTGPLLVITNPQDLVMANPQHHVFPFAFIMFGVVLALLLCIVIQRWRVMAVAANRAHAITEEKPIHKMDVETAMRDTIVKPSEALDDRVMHSILSDSPPQ